MGRLKEARILVGDVVLRNAMAKVPANVAANLVSIGATAEGIDCVALAATSLECADGDQVVAETQDTTAMMATAATGAQTLPSFVLMCSEGHFHLRA